MAKAISELQNLRRVFNDIFIVGLLYCNDKEAAKAITLRRFLFVDAPVMVLGLLLLGAILAMFG